MGQRTARRGDVETAGQVPRLTREERSPGEESTAEVPRSNHAEFAPAPDRPDPVELLQGDDASRVPELLPIRYGRMAVSAFTFFRGAALPMAADLAGTPRTGLVAQICGDAHLANFGLFASRNAGWCSTSTISTRPCPGRGSGTSNASRRASRSRAGTTATPPSNATASCSPRSPRTARRWPGSPRRRRWRSGTPTPTRTRSRPGRSAARGSGRSLDARQLSGLPAPWPRPGPRTTSGHSIVSPGARTGGRRSPRTRR